MRATSSSAVKPLALLLTIAGGVAAFWGAVYPRPYRIAILALAALPWVAVEVVRRSAGLVRLDSDRKNKHPNAAIPFIFPGMVLLLRAVTDYNLIPSATLVWCTAGIGGALFLAALTADRALRAKLPTLAAVLLFSLVYGYGSTVAANGLLDRSQPVDYSATVETKRVIRGKTTHYELLLAPWGPKTASNKLRVSRQTYDPVQPGDVVHLTMRQGYLGVPWYYLRAWQRGSEPAANPSPHKAPAAPSPDLRP